MFKILVMKKIFLFCLLIIYSKNLFAQPKELAAYNVLWTSQSKNSSESMPCGGGDIGLNVWVENGDVLFYLSRSGTFDENNQMLKLGRIRLQLSSNPFKGQDFRQELRLSEGGVRIAGGGTELNLWVDVFNPVIHVDIKSAKAIKLTAAYESWRYEDHLVTGTEYRANSYRHKQPFDVKTLKDEVTFQDNQILFYHRNNPDRENIFDYTVKMEGMESVKNEMFDPVKNNTFGGIVRGKNLRVSGNDQGRYASTNFKSWKLESIKDARNFQLEVGLHVAQSPKLDVWKSDLEKIMKKSDSEKKMALFKTQKWWKDFWNRSYIFINGSDSAVSRNYQLFRYQLGCNAYGKWPTKFNGGLFTFDPEFVDTVTHLILDCGVGER